MAKITYNGCSLPYPLHTSFLQEAMYDEQGKTDWYCTKFDITVQFFVNAQYTSLMNVVGADPAAAMRNLRMKLLEPRKTLSVKVNGVELIPFPQSLGTTVDAQNGPQPHSCVITTLTSETFICTYRITAKYWENTETGEGTGLSEASNSTLYNRWTESVTMDRRGYSTRSRNGKFIIRSDNVSQESADQIRTQMAVTGIPTGFYRESQTYTVDPSGLGIGYVIQDKETWNNPPPGIHVATGTYTETTARRGFMRFGEVEITMKGAKHVTVATLIETAVITAATKIRVSAAIALGDGGLARLESGRISVDLYDNSVTVNLKAMLSPNNGLRLAGVAALNFSEFATPVFNKTQTPPNMRPRGSANVFLQAAAFYNPSLRGTTLNQATGQLSTGNVPGTGN